jgi:hypothetical protein
VLVVIWDPDFKYLEQREGIGLFLEPGALLFEGAHHSLGVGVALRVVIVGKGLPDPESTTGLDEGHSGQLGDAHALP